jgi:pyruvate/2-oxoglutarate dehydrogenase complex dihydrolipoamide dehydrogenase (E3) component
MGQRKPLLELDTLPEHLLIVGGGPISCEMAQAFVRLGSKVTLIVRGDQLLEKDPAVMGNILANQLRQEGVTIHFEATIRHSPE